MQRFNSSTSLSRAPESKGYEHFESKLLEVPVKVRAADLPERAAPLSVAISMLQVPGTHRFTLQILLTEELDAFFLYAFECGEAEFAVLKHEQAILVDFMTFPHKFIELIEMCDRQPEEGPRLLCILEKNKGAEGTFNIVETNMFKQLIHLSLKFKGASDEVVKTHLATKLKEVKASCERLEGNCTASAQAFKASTARLDIVTRDLEKLQADFERKLAEKALHEQEKLANYKEQWLQEQSDLKNSHDCEKREAAAKHEALVKELQGKLEGASATSTELTSAKYSLEGRERELSSKLRHLSHELEMANSELESLRSSNKSLDTGKYEQERKLTEARLTLANLDRQLKDKEELIAKLNHLTETNADHKAQQEDTAHLLKATVAKLEDKLHQSAAEINKGNSIIQKLQGEIKSYKQKIKLKNTVVLQQEHVIQQKQEHIETLNNESSQAKRELERKDDGTKGLQQVVDELRNKLEETQKTLQGNSSTIQWLNNRLNDAEKTRVPYNSSYTPYKPSAAPSPALAFKPSTFTVEQFKTAASPRTSKIPAVDQSPEGPFSKLLAPIKYKEP